MAATLSSDRETAKPTVAISVMVDVEVVAYLEAERSLMGEKNLRPTLRRRLETAARRLGHFDRSDLHWVPLRRTRTCLHTEISAEAAEALKVEADRLDIDDRALLAGVLSDDLFASPLMMRSEAGNPSGYLRMERGRGRIYGINFEVAGYEYAFLKTVAGQNLLPSQVFGLAITSLATKVSQGDAPSGLRLSRDAVAMASQIAARGRTLDLRSS